MCTLIALWRSHPSAPLVLALNRDEFLDRPAQTESLWTPPGAAHPIVSGRDLKSGGTWFGVGRAITAGLTNHRIGMRSRPGKKSRGELVTTALGFSDLASLQNHMLSLDALEYGSFHLLAADSNHMAWFTNRNDRMEVVDVPFGAHVLGNYGLNDASDPVVKSVSPDLKGIEGLSVLDLETRLKGILSSHGQARPCVHLGPYGTRNASILWRGGKVDRFLTADGPPCTTKWTDHSELLTRYNLIE